MYDEKMRFATLLVMGRRKNGTEGDLRPAMRLVSDIKHHWEYRSKTYGQ
jgi:hypothetical protein